MRILNNFMARNWTIPWSVYLAGFVYGLMYWSAVTETVWARKKRDGYSAGDDGFHGQVGEAEKELLCMKYFIIFKKYYSFARPD